MSIDSEAGSQMMDYSSLVLLCFFVFYFHRIRSHFCTLECHKYKTCEHKMRTQRGQVEQAESATPSGLVRLQKHTFQSAQRFHTSSVLERVTLESSSAGLLSHFAIVTTGWRGFHRAHKGKHLMCSHWGIVFWAVLRQNTGAKRTKTELFMTALHSITRKRRKKRVYRNINTAATSLFSVLFLLSCFSRAVYSTHKTHKL